MSLLNLKHPLIVAPMAGGPSSVDLVVETKGRGIFLIGTATSFEEAQALEASGGIMTREQIRTALSLGAQAVQMGTAFLTCKEAGTSAPYRTALSSDWRETKTTRVFSGRLARGIQNRFMKEVEALGPDAFLPFPAQNKLTRDLRTASAKKNSSDFLSLWAGTGQGKL
jgi:nitronate monooxygenase